MKTLQRLTKNEQISTAGQVFGIIMSFLDITRCAVFTEKTSSKSNKNYMDGEEQTQ